tara:strand:+ start:10069 stop:10983 length:915 start_codon:yes stop_codon:yes gene_type:complete
MIFDINKTSFSAAVKRMQSTFTLQHCLGVVTHRLNRAGNKPLAAALSQAMGKYNDEQGLDRKRASEVLSQAITGDSYNVLASKMNKAQGELSPKLIVGSLRAALDELNAVIFTVGDEGRLLRESLTKALVFLVKEKSGGKTGSSAYLTMRKEYLPDANAFWESMHALLIENKVVKITTNGFGAPESALDKRELHRREVIFLLSDDSKITLNCTYTKADCSGDGVSLFSCSIYINEDDIYEFFDSSESHDDIYMVDGMLEAFADGLETAFSAESNHDLVDLDHATNKELLYSVVPVLSRVFTMKA